MRFFHGGKQRGPYFEGWYLKHQSGEGKSLALIPAFHADPGGRRSASLQVLAENGSWWLEYPEAAFQAEERRFQVRLGESWFSSRGVKVDVRQDGLTLQGELGYGPFTPVRKDIMGPFRFFAGMQCAHGILSMGHSLEGSLVLNGERLDFTGGTGYVETDRGRSFPSAYLWTQCAWPGPEGGSLMLAVAGVPLPVGSFTGCICAVIHRGREYRLATYRGAEIKAWSPSGAVIRQGRYRLDVELLEEGGQSLRAPVEGSMERTIHESLRAKVRYRFWRGEALLFQHVDPGASFEYSDGAEGPGRDQP